jgi:hypothetical protein
VKAAVAQLCDLLVTLVEEETSELTSDGDDTDVEVLETAAGYRKAMQMPLPSSHAWRLGLWSNPIARRNPRPARLIKFAETMEKAGARHSKEDAGRVQALHDHAEDVHKCMGEMVEKCAGMLKAAGEAKNTAIDLGAKGDRVDDEDDMEPASKAAVKMSHCEISDSDHDIRGCRRGLH